MKLATIKEEIRSEFLGFRSTLFSEVLYSKHLLGADKNIGRYRIFVTWELNKGLTCW
jgi:hypothetical protein